MSESEIAGVVRDGVVVPEKDLPEGARVTISLSGERRSNGRQGGVAGTHGASGGVAGRHGASRGVAGLASWQAPADILARVRHLTGETVPPSPQATDEVLRDLLAHFNAAPTWEQLKAEIEAAFPARVGLNVTVEEDHDVPGAVRVICEVVLPAGSQVEELKAARLSLEELAGTIVPGSLAHLFVCLVDLAPEQP